MHGAGVKVIKIKKSRDISCVSANL